MALLVRRQSMGVRRGVSKVSGILPSNFDRKWERVVCVASGPSLSIHQAQVLKDAFKLACFGWHVIVVNNTWQMIPTAEVLYASDGPWWDRFLPQVRREYKGECWTRSRFHAHRDKLHFVQCSDEPGLTTKPGFVFSGSNSGYQAVNLAYLFGAKEILLVGYDMQRTYGMSHWHGDHHGGLSQQMPMETWVIKFEQLAKDLRERGVRVVNCSIETALTCFDREDLESCLW
jgi:hypothetical protein